MLQVAYRWIFASAIIFLGFGTFDGHAANVPTIREFQHTAWTTREGAPSVASCFAQTPDGYFWIGSPVGLYRFDGVQFEKIQSLNGTRLREGRVSTLFTDREGGLWIGYDRGMSLYKNNSLSNIGEAEGFPRKTYVFHFAQDKQGRMWAATQEGLYHLGGNGRWLKAGADVGYNEPLAQEVAVDDDGTVWVLSSQNLFYLAEGASRFQKAAPQIGGFGFVYRHGGIIWTTPHEQSVRGSVRAFPYLNGSVLGRDTPGYVLDQSGGLWLENTGDGIYRISNAERLLNGGLGADRRGVEAFTTREGLSGNNVLSMFEDREHNVWIGTDNGLDRFTPSSFFSVPIPAGANRLSLTRGEQGSVIVASFHEKAMIIGSDGEVKGSIPVGGTLGATYRDVDNTLWLSSEHGILHLTRQRKEVIPLPDFHVRRKFDQVIAMTRDAHGSLWISIEGKGVYRYSAHSWQRIETGLVSADTAALCTFTDSKGTVWLGYPNNLVVAVGLQRGETYTRIKGLDLGNVKFLGESHNAMWAGGDLGVAIDDGDGFRRVQLANHEESTGLSGMIFAQNGDLFLTEQSRVLRIASAELEKARITANPTAEYQRFDFDGPSADFIPISRSVVASDGRLWFISSKGLAWLEPSKAWTVPQAPPVLVKGLKTQNDSFRFNPGLTLPPRTKSIQIAYTAMTLSSSENVRFRYRLEGSDTSWQDVGTRREAFYTNLGPGNYTFHVIANNGGDKWSDPGATFAFRITPAFNQTIWFYLACVATVCGLVYLLYLLKVRRFIALYELKNAERVAERERIARELHDTLLQGVHGLILRFSVLTTNYPEGDLTRAALDDTLARAEKMLIEGRQRVRDLRASTTPIDLPEALLEAGHEMAAGTIHFDLTVQGTPQPLRLTVSDESAKIGREAINNSVLHARCTKIEAELIYSKNFLVVRVRDDGAGFEPSAFVSKPVLDHWGIPGMQERAAALGGELNIFSKAGFGTEVELRVPGRVAFRKVTPVGPFHRLWRNIRRATAIGTIVPRGSRDKSE